jgi:ribonuclease P protein component
MKRFTLSKQERLSSLKDIEALFAQGKSIMKYPVRLIWLAVPPDGIIPASAVFTVSKKKFSRAVDRNRIKRLLRESYRLLKPDFYNTIPKGQAFHIGIVYIAAEILDLASIQNSLRIALERLINESQQTP